MTLVTTVEVEEGINRQKEAKRYKMELARD